MRMLNCVVVAMIAVIACTSEPETPLHFANVSNAELKTRYRCDAIVDSSIAGRRVKALIFRVGDQDYKVQWFAPSADRWTRIGPEFNLLGYDEPAIQTGSAGLPGARYTKTGELFLFRQSAAGEIDFVPQSGAWQRIR